MENPSTENPAASRASELIGRLSLLDAMSGELSDLETLSYVLDQAVAGLRGMAGMAHLSSQSRLRLVASSGLPPETLRAWVDVEPGDRNSAPARAARDETLVRQAVHADSAYR